ncbi:MAG: peptidoglycan DD-metalloendopeptidase family protein [Alphaproteobacteria bacterium]|nr:peptidoglycan DD-metalloendopeptidase family protein [Alphaproteobacteria bacterium]MBT4017114.1 peptidoglycan DD-metalloendopeptidase family protein [Alphaproteobacteria bacterium]MBT4966418.1 peptidoglycan DD-metalloendopeptidase family protein [Alphaproteobacteria bacterium]MBT5160913.1 peptidoglycan DD-metalloendopeptidase family protein [Alphaproteobacteria bacterium]MBT5919702.1 peptidoglycan DD-metalloendopeptidase family protein [Alphaproteobacteria bacterium]
MLRAGLLAGFMAGLLYPALPAYTADNKAEKKLQAVEEALKKHRDQRRALQTKAKLLGQDLKSMRKSLIGTAASVQRYEDMVSDFETRLAALAAEQNAKTKILARRRGHLANTLGTLARLSRHPPEALIVSPASPVDMVRGSMVLSAVVPRLEARAAKLASELDALRRLRIEIGQKRVRLASANQGLSKERTALDRLLKRTARQRQLTLKSSAREKRRLKRLASQAKDLKALIAKLEAEERKRTGIKVLPPPPGATPFSAEMGRLPLPARGPVVLRFGEQLETGLKSKGIKVATRPNATVVAPHDGRVVFAGAFRSYGRLLIIAHGEGYHTLIAGMAQIDGEVGQWLLAGEPVGQMGNRRGVAKGTAKVADNGGLPQLYLELRRQGEPINPLTWLAPSDRKVDG